MNKTLIRLQIVAEDASYEVVAGILALMVSFGWEEDALPDGGTLFRVHAENRIFVQDVKEAVERQIPGVQCSVDEIEEQDWLTAWKEFFTPVPCGRRFVVLPPWHLGDEGLGERIRIVIEPKSAFGTGHHTTTALCLEVLGNLLDEGRIVPGQSFLDLGTGSGVLGIGLCKSGLSGCGYDIDPIAVDNAVENRELNGIAPAQFEVGLGSIDRVQGKNFDVVVANILARPLMDLSRHIVQVRKKGGVLVLSGILTTQAAMVEEAFRKWKLPEAVRIDRGEWSALYWA